MLDYLVSQVQQLPIQVSLSKPVTLELVGQLKPDVIVVASGGRRAAPAIDGTHQKHVWSGDELRRLMTGDGADEIARAKLSLAERAMFKACGLIGVTESSNALKTLSKLWMPIGKKVVIVGGGLLGFVLAEFLLARGREVTVLEESDKPGRELSIVRRWQVLDAVERHGTLHRQARVRTITSNEVVWQDASGAEQRSAANSVVLAVGAQADDSVLRMLADCSVPVHAAGDCNGIGYIEQAMHQGNRIGRLV